MLPYNLNQYENTMIIIDLCWINWFGNFCIVVGMFEIWRIVDYASAFMYTSNNCCARWEIFSYKKVLQNEYTKTVSKWLQNKNVVNTRRNFKLFNE